MNWSLLDSVTSAIEKALDLRTRQHAMTVSNMANQDTPGYRARHVDFGRSMARLMRAHQQELRGQAGPGVDPNDQVVIELQEPPPWSADGNSVDPTRETAVLTENQLLYNASIEVLNRRIGLLRYAVTEGKR